MATVTPRKDFTAAKCVEGKKDSLVNRAAYTHTDSELAKVQGSWVAKTWIAKPEDKPCSPSSDVNYTNFDKFQNFQHYIFACSWNSTASMPSPELFMPEIWRCDLTTQLSHENSCRKRSTAAPPQFHHSSQGWPTQWGVKQLPTQ